MSFWSAFADQGLKWGEKLVDRDWQKRDVAEQRQAAERAQDDSQVFNAEQAALNRNFQSDQAQRQMDFQERMANTQHTRAVQDLQAAGLNPMLALTGGNAAPTGASGAGSAASSGIASPAMAHPTTNTNPAVLFTAAQIKNLEAQTGKTEAETASIRSTYPVNVELLKKQIERTHEEIATVIAQGEHYYSSASQANASAQHLRALLPQIEATIAQLKAQTGEIGQRVKENLPQLEAAFKRAETALKEFAMPGAYRQSQVYQGEASYFISLFREIMRALIPLGGALIP